MIRTVSGAFGTPCFAWSMYPRTSVRRWMTARVIVDVPDETEAAARGTIPANAVFSDDNGAPHVWVVDPSSMRVAKRAVEPGELSGASVSILSGLSDGDVVVVSGVNSLTDGMLVKELGGN